MYFNLHTAMDEVSVLPFLDLGDDARIPGEGKFFGILDHAIMLSETELPSYLTFPFGNDNETRIYVSYIHVNRLLYALPISIIVMYIDFNSWTHKFWCSIY